MAKAVTSRIFHNSPFVQILHFLFDVTLPLQLTQHKKQTLWVSANNARCYVIPYSHFFSLRISVVFEMITLYVFCYRLVHFFYIAMTSGAIRKHKDKRDKKMHEKKPKKKKKVNKSVHEEVKSNIFDIRLPLPIEYMIYVWCFVIRFHLVLFFWLVSVFGFWITFICLLQEYALNCLTGRW